MQTKEKKMYCLTDNVERCAQVYDLDKAMILENLGINQSVEKDIYVIGQDIGTGLDVISEILFLMPIYFSYNGITNLVYPICYIYTDGRCIFKLRLSFSEKDVNEQYEIVQSLCSVKYVNFIDSKSNQNCLEEVASCTFDELCAKYMDSLKSLDKKPLITDYTNIVITNINTNHKLYFKTIYCLSKSPINDQLLKKSTEDKQVDFGGLEIFSSSKKTVVTLLEEERIKLEKGIDDMTTNNKNLYIFSRIVGNYQIVLESILLRWYRLVYITFGIDHDANISKQQTRLADLELSYMKTENQVMFSRFESVVKLYNNMSLNIFPIEKMKIFEESKQISTEFIRNRIERKITTFSNMLAIFSVIMTLLFSYEPVKAVMEELGLSQYSLLLYIGLNILLIGCLYFVSNKNS